MPVNSLVLSLIIFRSSTSTSLWPSDQLIRERGATSGKIPSNSSERSVRDSNWIPSIGGVAAWTPEPLRMPIRSRDIRRLGMRLWETEGGLKIDFVCISVKNNFIWFDRKNSGKFVGYIGTFFHFAFRKLVFFSPTELSCIFVRKWFRIDWFWNSLMMYHVNSYYVWYNLLVPWLQPPSRNRTLKMKRTFF